jgi:hypothetical protein
MGRKKAMSKTTLDVMSEKCNECLFSENRIVRPGRMAEIIKDCRKKEKYFVCHKASLKDRDDVMCRGFFDTQDTTLIQIATRLNLVNFIEEKDL